MSEEDMDKRELYIRLLGGLMLKDGRITDEIWEYLGAREYGLALQALAHEVVSSK